MSSGRIAATVEAMIRARGLRPSDAAFSADMTSTAAAPSLSGQALPAVTVPCSGSKTGFSAASFSIVVFGRGPSSLVSSPPSGSVTATISLSKWPDSCAATARVCEIERPFVLRLARDLAARGDLLGGQAHRDVDVVRRALRAVELRVLGLLGDARAEPGARDGLDAGGDVLVALAGLDRVEGHAQRLQRRGAEAVDRAGRARGGPCRRRARRCGRCCRPARRRPTRRPSSRRRSGRSRRRGCARSARAAGWRRARRRGRPRASP